MADATTSPDSLDSQNEVGSEQLEPQGQGDKVSDDWESTKFRTKVRERIQDEIMKTGSQVPKTGEYLENYAFTKAKSKKEYLDLVAGIVVYVSEFNRRREKAAGQETSETDVDSQNLDLES